VLDIRATRLSHSRRRIGLDPACLRFDLGTSCVLTRFIEPRHCGKTLGYPV
jgi:hypothetical protein